MFNRTGRKPPIQQAVPVELRITNTPLDTGYVPAISSRLTTNYANLAKDPKGRSERIKSVLATINKRFCLALGEREDAERFQLAIDILTINIRFGDSVSEWFPMTEILSCRIYDRLHARWLPGPQGCNYSSYVRDYDFNILLPKILKGEATAKESSSFGDLHGALFKLQFGRFHPAGILEEPLIIAISVANGRKYRRIGTAHPVLGHQYLPDHNESTTSYYFEKMGLGASYFMPPGSRAPLAFYHEPGDLFGRSSYYLAALIAIMDTFESIYRPEIYCARSPAGDVFLPDLLNCDFDPPLAIYDRVERDSALGLQQALLAWNTFLSPNAASLRRLVADCAYE